MGLWTTQLRNKQREWVDLNEQEICKWYEDGNSILNIQSRAQPLKIGRDLIEKCLLKNGKILRGISQNGKSLQLEQAKRTSFLKYGYENASSSPAIKQKRSKTNIERYGVENCFQSEEKKKKIVDTNIKKYGVPNPGAHCVKNAKESSPHKKLKSILQQKYDVKSEIVIKGLRNGKSYSPRIDLLINDILIIEVYGDYFHANPTKYKSTDIISRYKGKMTCAQIWEEDEARIEWIKNTSKKDVKVIWEKEIKINLNGVLEIINAYFNCKN